MVSTLLIAALLSAQSLAVSDDHLPVYLLHRLYHPALPPSPFSVRATINLDLSGPHLISSPNFTHDLVHFLQDASNTHDALYQVAFHKHGQQDDLHLDISSVKACHIHRSNSDYLTLHLSSTGIPYSMDYYLSSVPHDGSCPRINANLLAPSIFNTTVFVRLPTYPPKSELRVPPPLSPQGEPIKPVPEKTFLQKYWLYILLALAALVMSGSAPEEETAPNAGNGGR